MNNTLNLSTWWVRDAANPVLPPCPELPYECSCCMNPYVVTRGGEYWLYYAGGDAQGSKRICLAIASLAEPTLWKRQGVVLDLGVPGAFDAHWTVLPHVLRINGRWHLYYTGNCGHGEGLAAFPGIGLAVSDDGRRFERLTDEPVLRAGGQPGDPDRYGMAGGSVIPVADADGTVEWRFYYTGCPSLGEDVFQNQQKRCCLAVSRDGVSWEKRGAVMLRDPARDYVNVAAAGPVVEQLSDGTFRMWYSAIGTRWGYYSICCAESDDGLCWRRGERYGNDLTLGPLGQGWERQMVEYPAVVREGTHRRLFYCGNGYGAAGIGTAVSAPLRALPVRGRGRLRVLAPEAGFELDCRLTATVKCNDGTQSLKTEHTLDWQGPTGDGMLWYEGRADADGDTCRLHYRALVQHRADGLAFTLTVTNAGNDTVRNLLMTHAVAIPRELVCDADSGFVTPDRGWRLSCDWEQADSTVTRRTLQMTVRFGDIACSETQTRNGRLTLLPA